MSSPAASVVGSRVQAQQSGGSTVPPTGHEKKAADHLSSLLDSAEVIIVLAMAGRFHEHNVASVKCSYINWVFVLGIF